MARAGAGPVGTSDAIRRHCRAATFRYGTRSMPTGAASGDDVPHARPAATAVGSAREQTAVTVWFEDGRSLPWPRGGNAMRITTGVLGTPALAALTAIAARREEARATIVDAPPPLTIS